MKKLGEESVLVRSRKVDEDMVRGLLAKSKDEYTKIYNEPAPELVMDKESLKPAPTRELDDPAFTW